MGQSDTFSRFTIETINGKLKNFTNRAYEASKRHGFMLNMTDGLIAYHLKETRQLLNITNAGFGTIVVMT